MQTIGRKAEIEQLQAAYGSRQSELLVVYGRRRVGKTFLVRSVARPNPAVFFELIGQKGEGAEPAPKAVQLQNFSRSCQKAFFPDLNIPPPRTWKDAFAILESAIVAALKRTPSQTIVLFFDELPWLESRRSGMLSELEHFYNRFCEQHAQVKVVLCGSAASWMLTKIIHARGGLHNRKTGVIHLKPFSLAETQQFLAVKWQNPPLRTVLDTYMAIGGVPYYLQFLEAGQSLSQNLERLCFQGDGILLGEYEGLFEALFRDHALHRRIVELCAGSRQGLTYEELARKLSFTERGSGSLTRALRNLQASSFLVVREPLFKKRHGLLYTLSDEYCRFHATWMRATPRAVLDDRGSVYWQTMMQSQRYRVWSGLTFEGIALKHADRIKEALGIHRIQAIPGMYYEYEDGKRVGQIDLLFDRADRAISVCEIKYHERPYTIDHAEAVRLQDKLGRLAARTKKQVFLSYLTLHGLQQTSFSRELVTDVLTAECLF